MSASLNPIVTRLKGRGPVPVSVDNPFLAANLLLTKASEASPVLKGFLEHRGNPTSLSVEKPLLSGLAMTLFYEKDQQMYLIDNAESVVVIRGPFAITNTLAQQLSTLKAEPESSRKMIPEPANLKPLITPTPVAIRTRTPKPKSSPTRTAEVPEPSSLEPQNEPFRSPPITPTPKRIETTEPIVTSDEIAELTPRGDVVHYVTSKNESGKAIARWYTKDEENADKLLRLNNIQTLEIGDTVVIPSYMVKRTVRMPNEDQKEIVGSQ